MTFFVYCGPDEFGAFIKRLGDNENIDIVLQNKLSVIIKGCAVIFLSGLLCEGKTTVGYGNNFIQLCRTGKRKQFICPSAQSQDKRF